MSDILEDLDKTNEAFRALDKIAVGEDVRLSADQAKRLKRHMKWLSNERESLLKDGRFDD